MPVNDQKTETAAEVLAEMRAFPESAGIRALQTWADRLERALSAQGEAVAYLVDWPNEPDLGHFFSEEPVDGARSQPLYTHPAPARVTEEARARHMDAVKEALSRWPEALPAIHFMSAALGPHDPITADDIAWAAAALEADHG